MNISIYMYIIKIKGIYRDIKLIRNVVMFKNEII